MLLVNPPITSSFLATEHLGHMVDSHSNHHRRQWAGLLLQVLHTGCPRIKAFKEALLSLELMQALLRKWEA
jgi:hypothetical protein